ncbi:MAG: ankyrin repeat domain-containing protein [Planctomycetales bacterium]
MASGSPFPNELLNRAIVLRREETVALFLEHGADVNGKDRQGRTPLYIACLNGCSLGVIQMLLERGADPNARSSLGEPLIENAKELARIRDCVYPENNESKAWTEQEAQSLHANDEVINLLKQYGARE